MRPVRMPQRHRQTTMHQMERVTAPVRSPTAAYYVDLTVDTPPNQRTRAPFRNVGVLRLRRNNSEAESSQLTSLPDAEAESVNCSNRLLPPKKRSRLDKEVKVDTVIDLDETAPPEVARINDSVNGETNVLTCPICFEYLTSKQKPMTTRCGHVYCSACIEQTLTMSKKCPKCRANITPKSCIRLHF